MSSITDRKTIKALLPALITTKEQEEMTKRSLETLISEDHDLEVFVDKKKYEARIAGVWNAFLDTWRGKEYDYLVITANDIYHDPKCIDFLVRLAEEHPEAGMVSGKVERDLDKFNDDFGKRTYAERLTVGFPKDPATMLFRKGVIEKVGRIDELFPLEFVERDYLYRMQLAGYQWLQSVEVLVYHPPFAGTIGNDQERLHKAFLKYQMKWGGDANSESFRYPWNDMNKDYKSCFK